MRLLRPNHFKLNKGCTKSIAVTLTTLPSTSNSAATNMAIDNVLLRTLPEDAAAYRHYSWSEPAITFGYTQRIKEVQTLFPANICLCRRATGGAIVDHRNDWTYSLVFHSSLQVAKTPATELYARIHTCIQQAIHAQSVETVLAPCPRLCGQEPAVNTDEAKQCFTLPATNDVLQPGGKKVAGAAMKRSRGGLLIQGSIDRSALPQTFNFNKFSEDLPEILSSAFDLQLDKAKQNNQWLNQDLINKESQHFRSEAWANKR